MAETYPLVEQREYGRPERRGGILRRRTTREEGDLPRVAAHQVRVFRVGEEYVEDHGELRADDPVVLAASSVTVVDRRAEVPVVVETRIPSADAGEFTVRVTYFSRVIDPCAVVRDGITDVEALLLAQLLAVPGLTEDGSDLPVADSSTVRNRIDARLTAYHEMRPSDVSGLRVRCGQVEVRTPQEQAAHLAELERVRREQERDLVLAERQQKAALDRAIREAELALKEEEIRSLQAQRKERNRHKEELDKEYNRQEHDTLRTKYTRLAESDQQDHELDLGVRRNDTVRAELAKDVNLIGNDPLGAAFLAFRSGEISADELSRRLHDAEKDGYARQDEWTRVDREYELQRHSVQRDDERWRLQRADQQRELTRKEEREEMAARRREQSRRWDLEHEDRLRRRQEERADAERWDRDEREWAKEQLAVRATLGKQAIDRGLFDSTMYDAGAFINSVGDVPQGQGQGQGRTPGGRSEGRRTRGGELAGDAPAELTADAKGEPHRASRPAPDSSATDGETDDALLDFGGTDQEASLGD
ncbi:hypothetical protein [Streptomyces aurantiogriseus]|uniref:Uncharacterized protein n=1 Tax=Streptomyces aurantiogriseus TaxID=66870 RepID=A0A918C4W8_9ACTN|nr:hypothetical protein [Streptomyces aurantiogriseus]GGR07002.1 hypothetical protein GCM10010251_23530 [Streptomyces aurantiogriseus]